MFYESIVRPLLFRLDPETAHHVALRALRIASGVAPLRALVRGLFDVECPQLMQEVWGLRFKSPVGLAAGFDKNARALPALMRLGFGFVEVGAVSLTARQGNPRPRIFRLPEDGGLINRMGLPNDGAAVIAARLSRVTDRPVPVFANIVKTGDLEGDVATMAADFVSTLALVLPTVDGVTVNISCPASPELKTFNSRAAMFELLRALGAERDRHPTPGGRRKPMALKVSPDVTEAEREVIADAAAEGLVDGLVLTNTTTSRPAGLAAPAPVLAERGGLSGRPLFRKSLEMVEHFAKRLGPAVPIIGVGGISDADDAARMLDAGARLVEIYTGFVYGGPALPSRMARRLAARRPTPQNRAPVTSGDSIKR